MYVKSNQHDHQSLVANEFLCARLASAVGLPVPAGDIGMGLGQQISWVSAVVDLEGVGMAPEDTAELVVRESDVAAGTFAFDVWVLNEDRYEDNILSHPKLGVWLIDHDQAFGGPKTGMPGHLDGCKSRVLGYHLLQDQNLDTDKLSAWATRIQNVPKSAIERLAHEGYKRSLYSREVADSVVNFLLHRQREIHRLVKRSLPVPSVSQEPGEAGDGAQGGEGP